MPEAATETAPAAEVLRGGAMIEGEFFDYGGDMPSDEELGHKFAAVSEAAFSFAKEFEARRAEIEADENLSDVGKAEKIRELGAEWLGSTEGFTKGLPGGGLAQMKLHVDRAKKELLGLEAELTPFDPPSEEDPAAAMRSELRDQEIRMYLRGMDAKERSARVRQAVEDGDESLLRAVLAQPAELSGLSPDLHGLIRRRALEGRHPEALARYEQLSEAVSAVERNVGSAAAVVRKLSGL